MRYLIEMELVGSGRPRAPGDGESFIGEIILPTLERCERLVEEGRIVAGGPMSGRIGIAAIVEVESGRELDELLASLPIWPRADTTVTPLSSFGDRRTVLLPRLDDLRRARRPSAA